MGKTGYAYSPALGRRVAVESTISTKQQPKRKRKRKPFEVDWVKYPAWWIEALRNASAGAHQLALVVLAEAFRREYIGGNIVLSVEVVKMSRATKMRAVRELVELGLIAVKQNGRQATVVSGIYTKKPSFKNETPRFKNETPPFQK